MGGLEELQRSLGVNFRDLSLLEQALIHRSYLNENPQSGLVSNERLEFLGDALLGFVVADELYRRAPERDEGELTALRSALVRKETLAELAAALHLGEYLRLGRGEEASGGRHRLLSLARTYEAVVGAILIDAGLDEAKAFTLRSLGDEVQRLLQGDKPIDPKSRLQELLQRQGRLPPSYPVVGMEGPEHQRRFTVEAVVSGVKLGEGKGRSKQQAEMAAAQEALERLEGRLEDKEPLKDGQ